MEPKEVAVLCYDQGWRDRNLITMVSICGAESNFDPNFKDVQLGYSRYGLFGLNRLYTNTVVDLPADDDAWASLACNPPQAVRLARQLYERYYFSNWLSYQTGDYLLKVQIALGGIVEMFTEMYEKKQTISD